MSSVLGVIPARYASVRFPGKPLAMIMGKPMVQWVAESAQRAIKRVVVATDDKRIMKAVQSFGGQAVLTPASCASGTERMAYVAKKIKADYYVNVQGDEPLISADTIRSAVALAVKKKAIGTPVTDLAPSDFQNPNAVKVAVGEGNRAIYFSRAPIPFPRNGKSLTPQYKHIGVYVFPRKQLFQFVSYRPTALERTEMLEQLRALYYGMPIFVSKTRFDSIGVDTPADLKAAELRMKMRRHKSRSR